MNTIKTIKEDLKIKVIITLCFAAFIAYVCLFSPYNFLNFLAGCIVFGLLFIILVIGILSDYRALKRYDW